MATELAEHVAGVVIRDSTRLRDVHRRQVPVGEKLGQLLRARCHRACPFGRFVIADDLEQLGPEDSDHRGARPRRHDDGVAVGLAQRVECRACDLGRCVGEARVPRRLAAACLSRRHVDLASRGAKHLHGVDARFGLEEVDETGDQQRDAHGSTVAGLGRWARQAHDARFAFYAERVQCIRDRRPSRRPGNTALSIAVV